MDTVASIFRVSDNLICCVIHVTNACNSVKRTECLCFYLEKSAEGDIWS